jgi:hypothetical protein
MKITVLARNTVVSQNPTVWIRAAGVSTTGVHRLMYTPAVTTASTPLRFSCTAGTYAMNGTITEMTACSRVARIAHHARTASQPTASPIATAPSEAATNSSAAVVHENVIETTAAIAMT